MATKKGTAGNIISHWHHSIEGMQESPKEFYAAVEEALKTRSIPDVQVSRVTWKEGGVFSASREYLRVRRKDHIFDICGAPFGNGFFVSWWLSEPPPGCLAALANIPFLGEAFQMFVKPLSFYKIDSALMFQGLTHAAVIEVMDGLTEARGLRALSESERKPVMREFYA